MTRTRPKCNGEPGKAGIVLRTSRDMAEQRSYEHQHRCLGCSVCHPSDCINCGTADDGLCSGYHGPDCDDCGGTGRLERARPKVRYGPCTTYRKASHEQD